MKVLLCLFAVTLVFYITTAYNTNSASANVKITELTAKQQAIVPIAANVASGDIAKLKPALNEGLDSGLTLNETKEIIVHLYAYCGFPRALNGLAALSEVVNEREAQGIATEIGRETTPIPPQTDMLEMGTQVQTKLAGAPVNIAVSPAIDKFLKTHLFGDLFARDVLNFEEREIATIAGLASMSGTNPQLEAHYGLGHNANLSYAQLQDIVNVLDSKVSDKIADNAQQVLDAYLAKTK